MIGSVIGAVHDLRQPIDVDAEQPVRLFERDAARLREARQPREGVRRGAADAAIDDRRHLFGGAHEHPAQREEASTTPTTMTKTKATAATAAAIQACSLDYRCMTRADAATGSWLDGRSSPLRRHHHVRIRQGQLCDLAALAREGDLRGRHAGREEHQVAGVHQAAPRRRLDPGDRCRRRSCCTSTVK